MNSRKIKNMKIKVLVCTFIIVAIALIVCFLCLKPINQKDSTGTLKTTSTGSSRQNNASSGSSQGGVVDSNGIVSVPVPVPADNSGISSDSGLITLKSPIAKAKLTSGDEISGLAAVDKIQYRLVDTVAGVVSQGGLNVVDGRFAGKVYFNQYSNSAVLVVYSFDALGREKNEIQVSVGL